MTTQIDWPTEIAAAQAQRPEPVRALTFIKAHPSASQPVFLSCDDGEVYVVKGGHAGRQIVNDQVVGILGEAMHAPTGSVTLVEVPAELIALEPQLQKLPYGAAMQPGVWHGSRHVGGVSDDREAFDHVSLPENRVRFALLAVLYGWAYTMQDHQFLYAKVPPQLVYSVDHGHFFHGGPNWTAASLTAAPNSQPDPVICNACALTADELANAVKALAGVDAPNEIARAVATPPEHWQFSDAERVVMAEYLLRRYQELTASAPTP